jgi:glycerophosphoryl diester phosphodiesterase
LRPVAHRGLHNAKAGVIENTASAVSAAMAKGYAVEVDVQPARGAVPVVFHDEDLDRLMDATGPVADRSAAELRRLSYLGTTDRIITLDELLELVSGRVPLFVEIKTIFGPLGPFEREIAKRVRDYRGPLAVMSFDHASMAVMKELEPDIPRGMISYRWDDGWMHHISHAERARLRNLGYHRMVMPSFIAYDIGDLPEAAPLALKQRLGIPLLAWTVRTDAQRRRAARYADEMIFEGFEP